ncbi:MAG TPA: multifunctional nuclease/2',3'-cyclic-nucleotide 2'-phosphodiesterase/5'-nucleotidase/3'-nucleotidase, partial [Propionibacteriaceae bacterium]|nr:multifunctional nuclease/2',3'-cyclic-nucleotide 2'-phosphodiesterase/5'-nucleotidase/3'-nucleotidase [Propionibacteriaceae bacterium]
EVNTATGEVTTTSAKVLPRTTTAEADLVATYPRAAAVKTITDAALAHAAEVGNQPVGTLTADITTAFTGSFVDGAWVGTKRDDRSKASTIGGLVANSLVESLADPARGGANIGIMNPGGLRAELTYAQSGTEGDGVITYAEANSVLPFVNNLWTTTLTGAQLTQVLEEQWQPEGSSRPYLQLSLSDNVRYTYDPAAEKGHHITHVWVNDKLVTDTDTYRVGSASFLIQGGDNFTTFAQGTDTKDSGLLDYEAWIDYLKAHQPVAPDFAKQGVALSAPATATVGEPYSLKASDLDLTSLGSPANTSLEIRVGNTLVDTVAVTDGAAEATITIPNTGAVTVTALPSKTTVTIPVAIQPASTTPATATHTTLTLSKKSVRYGTSVLATAAVTGTDTGKVLFEVGGRKLTATLRGGMARVTLPNDLQVGKYLVKASFVATQTAAASSAKPVKLTITKAAVKPRKTRMAKTVKAHKAFRFTVATKALGKGVWATGTVKIYLHGHLVAKTKLTAADHGSKRVRISAQKLRWYGKGSTVTAVAKLGGTKNTKATIVKKVRLHLT